MMRRSPGFSRTGSDHVRGPVSGPVRVGSRRLVLGQDELPVFLLTNVDPVPELLQVEARLQEVCPADVGITKRGQKPRATSAVVRGFAEPSSS